MRLLLDTTVLIDLLRDRRGHRIFWSRLSGRGHVLLTSVINVAEIYAGMREPEQKDVEAILAGLTILGLDEAIARRAGSLKAQLARKGRTVSLADMLVAATTLTCGLTLITANRKDFAGVTGLRIHDLRPHPL